MKILIASDKFKGSLSSLEACDAIKQGILKANSKLEISILPMADGGDGLSEIIEYYTSAIKISVKALDPLFRPITSSILLSKDGSTAFVEMAKASGLGLLEPHEYNCSQTTSYGTGQLILEAIKCGATNILVGLGGSATNDCGIGMAKALGYSFFDKSGNEIEPIGANLIHVHKIENNCSYNFKKIKFEIACDVKNPLLGINGATKTFGRQKGANDTDILELESGMLHFSKIVKKDLNKDVFEIEGAGAAGGLGAACMIFLNAELQNGIQLVLKLCDAENQVKDADLVITGEGKIDEQSLNGKVLSGLIDLCRKYNKPLIAFCGELAIDPEKLKKAGAESVYAINSLNDSFLESIKSSGKNLSDSAYQLGLNLSDYIK